MVEGPKPVTNKKIGLNIAGNVFPMGADGRPQLVCMPGTEDLFLPTFTTVEKLRAFEAAFAMRWDDAQIKQVDDGREFVLSVIGHFRVIVDPYRHESGAVRFLEVAGVPLVPGEGS